MTDLAETREMGGPGDAFVRGSAWLVASMAIQAVSGATFWLVAARIFPSRVVGQASGLFAVVLFLNFLTSMGLQVAVAHFAAEPGVDSDVLYTWGTIYTIATAVLGGVVYLAVATPAALEPLRTTGYGGTLLVLVLVGSSLALLNDARLVAARRWRAVLIRVTVVGLVRVPLLWLSPIMNRSLWLFVLAAGVLGFSGFGLSLGLPRLVGMRYRLRPWPDHGLAAFRYATTHWVTGLAQNGPTMTIPFLVFIYVPAVKYANFYVAWTTTMTVLAVPVAMCQVLLVEGTRSPDLGHRHATRAVRASLGLMLTASLLAFPLRRAITWIYGSGYRTAAQLLPRLMLAAAPWALIIVSLTVTRIRRESGTSALVSGTFLVAVVAPAASLVPSTGIDGAVKAWVAGTVGAGVMAGAVLKRALAQSARRDLEGAPSGSYSVFAPEPSFGTLSGAAVPEGTTQ